MRLYTRRAFGSEYARKTNILWKPHEARLQSSCNTVPWQGQCPSHDLCWCSCLHLSCAREFQAGNHQPWLNEDVSMNEEGEPLALAAWSFSRRQPQSIEILLIKIYETYWLQNPAKMLQVSAQYITYIYITYVWYNIYIYTYIEHRYSNNLLRCHCQCFSFILGEIRRR